jgi:hypothetical protein
MNDPRDLPRSALSEYAIVSNREILACSHQSADIKLGARAPQTKLVHAVPSRCSAWV